MTTIDWWGVGFGIAWVGGLSLNLAAFSLADYQRTQTGKSWRQLFESRGFQLAVNIGWAMVCLGLAGSGQSVWETGFWCLAGGVFLAFAARAAFRR